VAVATGDEASFSGASDLKGVGHIGGREARQRAELGHGVCAGNVDAVEEDRVQVRVRLRATLPRPGIGRFALGGTDFHPRTFEGSGNAALASPPIDSRSKNACAALVEHWPRPTRRSPRSRALMGSPTRCISRGDFVRSRERAPARIEDAIAPRPSSETRRPSSSRQGKANWQKGSRARQQARGKPGGETPVPGRPQARDRRVARGPATARVDDAWFFVFSSGKSGCARTPTRTARPALRTRTRS
jgi:hypothetical protein